jgi:hypothetical protein
MFQFNFCNVSNFHNNKHNIDAKLDDRTSMFLIEIIRGLLISTKKL